jgi:hypothetical protein
MGHPVVTVWCPSADLIKWKDFLEKDIIIQEKDVIIQEKDAMIEQLKRELARSKPSKKRRRFEENAEL